MQRVVLSKGDSSNRRGKHQGENELKEVSPRPDTENQPEIYETPKTDYLPSIRKELSSCYQGFEEEIDESTYQALKDNAAALIAQHNEDIKKVTPSIISLVHNDGLDVYYQKRRKVRCDYILTLTGMGYDILLQQYFDKVFSLSGENRFELIGENGLHCWDYEGILVLRSFKEINTGLPNTPMPGFSESPFRIFYRTLFSSNGFKARHNRDCTWWKRLDYSNLDEDKRRTLCFLFIKYKFFGLEHEPIFSLIVNELFDRDTIIQFIKQYGLQPITRGYLFGTKGNDSILHLISTLSTELTSEDWDLVFQVLSQFPLEETTQALQQQNLENNTPFDVAHQLKKYEVLKRLLFLSKEPVIQITLDELQKISFDVPYFIRLLDHFGLKARTLDGVPILHLMSLLGTDELRQKMDQLEDTIKIFPKEDRLAALRYKPDQAPFPFSSNTPITLAINLENIPAVITLVVHCEDESLVEETKNYLDKKRVSYNALCEEIATSMGSKQQENKVLLNRSDIGTTNNFRLLKAPRGDVKDDEVFKEVAAELKHTRRNSFG